MYNEILREGIVDRGGDHIFSVRVLHEFGISNGYLTAQKIGELWRAFKDNPVIFTDDIEGDFESFFDVLMNPLTCWYEVFDEISFTPVGVYCISGLIPGYELTGHFAFWDRIASGRERLTWRLMKLFFDRFSLRRMNAEIPAYQSGTLRACESLGFVREGVKRKAVRRKGTWNDLILFGILQEELEEAMQNGTTERAKRNTA
jgi:hypothetical protein